VGVKFFDTLLLPVEICSFRISWAMELSILGDLLCLKEEGMWY
jgi:hypothetical protein